MFDSLRSLPDSQIITGTKQARSQEHDGMLSLLGFLVETERRKLHLKLGYSSMFKYCTRALGHSEAEALLRITAARCLMSFPEIFPLLRSKEVNLSTLARVSKILNRGNCTAVLERIRGKSMREVEAIAAEYDPAVALPRERVKTVVVRVPVSQAAALTQSPAIQTMKDHLCNSGKISSTPEATPASAPEPARTDAAQLQLERRSVLTIPADDEFMAMLAQVKDLASHQLRTGMGMQDVLKIAMRYYIDHKDPRARAARREARGDKKPLATGRAMSSNPRQVPAALRDQVFARDERCAFVGPDGRRCNSTHTLQVDHIKPVARLGTASIDNLRLLCAKHNRLEWERLMGTKDCIRESYARYTPRQPDGAPQRQRRGVHGMGSSRGAEA